MGFLDDFGNIVLRYAFGEHKNNQAQTTAKPTVIKAKTEPGFMPVGNVRSSVESGASTFAPTGKLQEIKPDFAIEYLSTIENLAAFNPDISYGLDNIVTLGNTEHDIYFSDKIPESKQSEMRNYLLEQERTWYGFSGGVRSLKGDLLTQIVINGALSAEAVPREDLTAIKKIVRVSPKHIRFIYDKEADEFYPYQNVNILSKASSDYPGKVKLNTTTYKYIAYRRYFETPYAVPPFITAIEALCIQRPMLANFKNIMDKMGMLGFLTATVTSPEQNDGEDDTEYWNRCVEYLDKYIYPQMQKNLSSGLVVGFKDAHEFKLEGNNMNVAGADGLVQLVQLMIFAGLKQDPNMLGRNYSTTETFGRVILEKMLSQIRDYQSLVDQFFSEIYTIALRLKGYEPGYVKVVSKPPMINDRLKDAQAETAEISNVLAKRNAGIIGQKKAANELGYDEPETEDFEIPGQQTDAGTTPPAEKKKVAPAKNSSELIEYYEQKFGVDIPEWSYECNLPHVKKIYNFDGTDFGDKNTNKLAVSYIRETGKVFNKAIDKVSNAVGAKFDKYNENTALNDIQNEVWLTILSKWDSNFVVPMDEVIKKNVEAIYNNFRKDKKAFGNTKTTSANQQKFASADDIPEAVFSLKDYRTIEYMEQHDNMYLGKFITDKDTKARVYKYIEANYIDGNLPIGKNKSEIQKFIDAFREQLSLEAWKIRRIIDTSVTKLKSFGHLRYLSQAEIEKFEVIELIDNVTCAYCEHMDGMEFSVETAVSTIDDEISAGPGKLAATSPFATTYKIDAFKKLTQEDLESSNIVKPPFHPHCRGRLVSV